MIFGKYDTFTLSLISRLKKEDYTVFAVTGSNRKNRLKPIEVFQEYNFTYDSDSISYILKSVDADIVIFTGTLDSGFNLQKQPAHISKYIAGITNVILHCKDLNIKKFIYISSCSVFNDNLEEIITEHTEPMSMRNADKAIIFGEKICTSYYKELNFPIDIVRIGEVYGKYKDEILENNICTNICKEAIKGDRVTIYTNKVHNLVYIDDVVDCIYRITKKNSNENTIYNIASQEDFAYSEEDLVRVLEEIIDKKISIDTKDDLEKCINHTYQSENVKKLGFNEKYDIKKGMKNLYYAIEKKPTNIKKKNKVKPSLKLSDKTRNKIIPIIENIVFFLILQSFVILTRNISFHEIIDVYLLYVLLIGVIYGYLHAAFAAIFSIIGKIYVALLWHSQYVSMNGNNIYLWILQIFTIAVLVGYIKDKYKRKYEDLNDEKEYLQLELTNIKDINKSNIEIKSLYEKRLINYKDSFARIYDIVSQLDAIEPERIIFKAVNVMCEIMNTNDVAIYTCDKNSQFCRLMAASSEKAKMLKKSLRISSHKDIYMKLSAQEIYVNNTLNPDYPIMIGGTYKDNQLQTIIMIWSLPFENNNLYEMNIFGVLCKLMEKAMHRAYEYMENINKSYNRKYDGIMNSEAFEKILNLYEYGEKENLVDFSLLKVKSYGSISEEEFYIQLKNQVRDMDYIGVNDESETYVLLTNSNKEEAKYVIERLNRNGILVEFGDKNANNLSD